MELQKQTLAEAEARLVPYVDWQNGYAAKLNCVPTPLYIGGLPSRLAMYHLSHPWPSVSEFLR